MRNGVNYTTCIKCGARNLTIKGLDRDGGTYVRGSACKHQDGRRAMTYHGRWFKIVQRWDSKSHSGFTFETPFGEFTTMTAAKAAMN